MPFDDVALAVMRKAWPDYNIGFEPESGTWKATHRVDLRAPAVTADSPEELTLLLFKDASRRRRGGGDSEG